MLGTLFSPSAPGAGRTRIIESCVEFAAARRTVIDNSAARRKLRARRCGAPDLTTRIYLAQERRRYGTNGIRRAQRAPFETIASHEPVLH
jgi:hypothetical protein